VKTKAAWRNIALMVVIGAAGLTQFTENVRAVQVLGLLATGAMFGVALSTLFVALKLRKNAS